MKKLLLIVFSVFFSLAAVAADPNPYAYAASAEWVSDYELKVNWSTQAPATAIKIVATDKDGDEYVIREYGYTVANAYSTTINMLDAVAKGLNTNEDVTLRIDVYGKDRTSHEVVGKKAAFRSPFSIDIDNHPYSSNFGVIYTTQLMWYDKDGNGTNDYPRGIWKYDQWMTLLGAWMGTGLEAATGKEWFKQTHGVPHMVRVLQDGTGRLLVTSSDRDQSTHLWLVKDPAHMTSWTEVINSSDIKSAAWTDHGKYAAAANFGSVGFDIRENGNNWEMLLYTASIDKNTEEQAGGYTYSGIYTVPKTSDNLKGGTYTRYTQADPSNPDKNNQSHPIVSDSYTGSMFTANANFDKYGGVLYNAYSLSKNPDNSALIHRTTNGAFKTDYADGDYLKRKSVVSKGLRFNHDFSKVAIAQGNQTNEIRFYDVTHTSATSHPTFTNGKGVDIITETKPSNGAYVHDIAWDYASNVYATVRNQASCYGIYVIATDLNGKAVSTPIKGTIKVNCPVGPFNVTVAKTPAEGGTVIGGSGSDGAGPLTNLAGCTMVKVVATPDAKYKFIGWYDGATLLSTDREYTFPVVKNITVTAHFEFAEYSGLIWKNLFQNGEDITKSSLDGTLNNRLWRLYQVQFNKYAGSRNDKGQNTYGEFDVAGFIGTEARGNSGVYYLTVEDCTETNPFVWLRKYIEDVSGTKLISGFTDTGKRRNHLNYILYMFFNRTNIARNSSGADATYLVTWTDNTKSFKGANGYGMPEKWRPYWTEYACKLPSKLKYSDPMPVTWTKLSCSTASVKNDAGQVIGTPANWHKWNEPGTEQLLAWRNGSTSGPIVHHVTSDNMELYATYVDKIIDETKNNTDVVMLLKNTNHGKTTTPNHNITVKHSFLSDVNAYNTICLPFSLTTAQLAASPYAGATILKFINTEILDDGEGDMLVLNFEQVTSIEAGVPYLIQPKSDLGTSKTFTGVPYSQCSEVAHSVECEHATFHAVLNNGEVKVDAYSPTLVLVDQNRLALVSSDGTMKGLRGYFTINPSVASLALDGKCYLSMRKPTTTTVEEITASQPTAKEPKAQKIMRDGKIYILHGDHIYTITGQKIR